MPTARGVAVVKVATPLASSVPVPRIVVPSMKLTAPVGVPVAGGVAVTVAVKVTGRPNAEALGEEVRVNVGGDATRVRTTLFEVRSEERRVGKGSERGRT